MTAPTKTGEVGTFPSEVVDASYRASTWARDLSEELLLARRGGLEYRLGHYQAMLAVFDSLAKSMEVIRAHVASEGVR